MHYSSGTKRDETPDERTAEGDCTAWYTMPPHDARMWAARRGGEGGEGERERRREGKGKGGERERERRRRPDREGRREREDRPRLKREERHRWR